MKNIYEADYGLGPLRDVEDAIDAGIKTLFRRNKEHPWFDGYWMNEYGEVLHGSLLVAAQAYCLGAIKDTNMIRKSKDLISLDKHAAYRSYTILKNGHTYIELFNAAANCFKHRDEWGDKWPTNTTTQILAAFSITSTTEFPLNEIFDIINNEQRISRLSDILSEWRMTLINLNS